MSGTDTPSQEGPSFAPPPLPEGYIAQWDGMSKKYYFVQLSTGVSQWDVPTQPASTGPPGLGERSESYPGEGAIVEGTRGVDGPESDRSLGSMAMNYAMNAATGKHGNQSSNSGLMGMAGQFLGGSKPSHHSNSNASAGGIVGALASNIFSSGGNQNQNQHQQPTNYTGQHQYQPQPTSGLMGKVTGMFGGTSQAQQNFGYSQSGNQGGYTGQAPPTSYQPDSSPAVASYQAQQDQAAAYAASSQPPQQPPQQPQHSYDSTPSQPQQPPYGAPPTQQPPYGSSSQPPYNSPPPQQPPYHSPPPQYPTQQQTPFYSPPPNPAGPPPGPPPPSAQQPPYGGYPGQQQHSGNLARPDGHHFFGGSHEGGLFGSSQPQGPPPGQQQGPGMFGGRPDGGRW